MRKTLFGAVLLAATAATAAVPAWSADLGPVRPAPVAGMAYSWTSWYLGGFVGGALAPNATATDPCRSAAATCWLSTNGGEVADYTVSSSFIGGGTAGINYQLPGKAAVFGIETEFAYLKLDGSSSFAAASTAATAGNLYSSVSYGSWYNVTAARVGFAWDRILFYGKGGLAVAPITTSFWDSRGFLPAGVGKNDYALGWAGGGGIEWAVLDNWSVKAEYVWLGLNKTTSACATAAPNSPVGTGVFCADTHNDGVHTFKLGFNYLFNSGPVYAKY